MRTLFYLLYFFAYLIVVSPKMHKARKLEKVGDLEHRDAIVVPEVKKWAYRLLKKTGVTVTTKGLANIPQEPVVFVSNHQGYFDIPVLFAALDEPHPLLAKKEMGKIPLLRTWMHLLGCIFLDRENPRQSMSALHEAEKLVEQGYSMVIFPEGTRAKSDTIGEFKGGAFRVASKSRVKLVPVIIDGSYKALEGNGYRVQKTNVKVTILPAVLTVGLSREELKHLPGQIEEMMRAEMEKPRELVTAK